MRILLKEGMQKELIKKEKLTRQVSLSKLAKCFNIKVGRMNSYYYDRVLLPKNIFDKFIEKEKYKKYITEIKENNWGRIKGGINSHGSHIKKINIPKESKELAEFYGIMLGDGNLTKIKGYKIGTYQIKIVGDSRYDKTYLKNYVKPLMEKLFEVIVACRKQKNKNALYLLATGKEIVDFLELKEFKAGNKIKNQLKIPIWIKKNKILLKFCLRGLYDTDGSVYKLTNQNTYQFSFRNYNASLINDVRDSLISLNIGVSKISKGNEITITKKEELRKFLKEIGFSNNKHLNKIKMWNLVP